MTNTSAHDIKTPEDITALGQAVRAAFAGGHLRVIIKPLSKGASISQRNYLEFCFQYIGDHVKQDRDTVRETILADLLGEEINEVTLKKGDHWRVRKRRSSVDLDREAMADVISAVQQYSKERLGIDIPPPNSAAEIADSDARYDRDGKPAA